jgi:hypothetical protein
MGGYGRLSYQTSMGKDIRHIIVGVVVCVIVGGLKC